MLTLSQLNNLSTGELENELFQTQRNLEFAAEDFEEREREYKPFCEGSVKPDLKLHMLITAQMQNYQSLVAQILNSRDEEPIFNVKVLNMKVRVRII